jgi:translation initiation factor 2B subunit (eIF-2B alpha/beta/delta family)
MAAVDLFESLIDRMTEKERDKLSEAIRTRRNDLLAARSEDARLRIVTEFIEESHELLHEPQR